VSCPEASRCDIATGFCLSKEVSASFSSADYRLSPIFLQITRVADTRIARAIRSVSVVVASVGEGDPARATTIVRTRKYVAQKANAPAHRVLRTPTAAKTCIVIREASAQVSTLGVSLFPSHQLGISVDLEVVEGIQLSRAAAAYRSSALMNKPKVVKQDMPVGDSVIFKFASEFKQLSTKIL